MGDSVLGLILGLSMDNTQALMDAGQFGASVGKSFEQTAERTKPLKDALDQTDKNLLSNRESARLLTEELGVHMPRAVTSAIAEVMPAIGSLGTTLLGIFALKEIMAFGRELHKVADEFDGVAAAEKRAGQIGKENLSLLEKQVEGNKKLLMGELTRAQFRAVADEAELNAMKARDLHQLAVFGPYAAGYMAITGALGKLTEAQNKLAADQGLADKMATILRKDNEEEAKAHDKAAKAAKAHAEAEKEVVNLVATVFEPSMLVGQIDGMTKAINGSKVQLDDWVQEIHYAVDPQALPLLRTNLAALSPVLYQSTTQFQQHASAIKVAAQAMESDTAAQAAQLAISVAGLVAGRKAQAEIEAVWETARGIACLAEGAWPPNPAAIVAAGLHFEAAAQYAIMAGSGGGRHGGAGAGAGASSQWASGGSGGGRGVERGGGGPSGGSSMSREGGGVTVVQVPGNMGTNAQQQMAAWLGIGASAGIFKINSQGSSGLAVPSY